MIPSLCVWLKRASYVYVCTYHIHVCICVLLPFLFCCLWSRSHYASLLALCKKNNTLLFHMWLVSLWPEVNWGDLHSFSYMPVHFDSLNDYASLKFEVNNFCGISILGNLNMPVSTAWQNGQHSRSPATAVDQFLEAQDPDFDREGFILSASVGLTPFFATALCIKAGEGSLFLVSCCKNSIITYQHIVIQVVW